MTVAPRAVGILDQRDITVQSYQTTVPFEYEALDAGLNTAWLTPQIRFGLFSRQPLQSDDAITVVLGLQDELSIRTYDYDQRRPLWFSWQDVIVDTVSIHYFRDDEGLLRFTTTGGGRRITDDRLDDFNATFLSIPKRAVSKRHFDVAKLRTLCFDRFVDRLYMLRFSDPSGDEYRSIDHALFPSRRYIDPQAERLREIRADERATIESFDSDLEVRASELAAPIHVRFFLRGFSGSLRLRFPKISYKNEPKTPEEMASVFYHIVDVAVSEILDADYYTQQPRSLDDLDSDLGMFPDMVDLAQFREVLASSEARSEFLLGIDLDDTWQNWQPHLRALDELVASEVVSKDVAELVVELTRRSPQKGSQLIGACQADPKTYRLGAVVAGAVAGEMQAIPAGVRAQVEERLLSWTIEHELDTWDVDPDTGVICVLKLRWQIEDLSLDVLPIVLWKLLGVLHARLVATDDDIGSLLRKLDWCIAAAKALPPNHVKSPRALRLIAASRVPRSAAEGAKVLKAPVADLRSLDDAVLDQFGLPLWPVLTAVINGDTAVLANTGLGAAIAVVARPAGVLFGGNGEASSVDLLPGESLSLPLTSASTVLDVQFEKLGRQYRVALPIADTVPSTVVADNIRALPAAVSRKRRAAQRKYRETIDTQGIVIGTSSAILEVFEHIYHANAMDGRRTVLMLGEPGVGKTHIAQLLHESSDRASGAFTDVNAGGGGGDVNIQRGEGIGYGKGRGIQGIDRNGRPGHLMNVDGGTLFVDEFAALSNDLQVIFLSVLEGRSIEKIGGESVTPDVRCIFATNADIDDAIAEGSLRRDLVDRIDATFRIPPLRKRCCDILVLARHFAADDGITDRCQLACLRYDWPGNIRELQKMIARAAARKTTEEASAIDLEHVDLPSEITQLVEPLDGNA